MQVAYVLCGLCDPLLLAKNALFQFKREWTEFMGVLTLQGS